MPTSPPAVALVVFGIPAAIQQQRYSPIMKDEQRHAPVDWARLGIVALILVAAILTNVTVNLKFKELADNFPFIGVAVWVVILRRRAAAQAAMGARARGVQGQHLPARARHLRLADAGGEAAAGVVAERVHAWASSPPSSTTFR